MRPIIPIDVIFTGLIRYPDRFKQTLNQFKNLQKSKIINKIIFSTWDYEIDKYEGLRDFLKRRKVVLVEEKEPSEPGPGHIWNQMKSLEYGVKKATKDRFILKTRPDLTIKTEFIEKLTSSPEKFEIKNHLPKGNKFKYKIWLPYFEISKPFYLSDECFIAHYEDINKLYNYNKSFDDYDLGHGITHIRRYLHIFIKDYKTLQLYLSDYTNIGLQMDNKKKFSSRLFYKIFGKSRFGLLKRRLRDKRYLQILATYYYILYSHFYIESTLVDRPFEMADVFIPNIKMNLKVFENNFKEDKKKLPEGQIYSYNMDFLENLIKEKFRPTKTTRLLYYYIRSLNNVTS